MELAAANDGLIWEHYDANWQLDMRYNIDKLKSPPGKTDYHTMGACWDVLTQQ